MESTQIMTEGIHSKTAEAIPKKYCERIVKEFLTQLPWIFPNGW